MPLYTSVNIVTHHKSAFFIDKNISSVKICYAGATTSHPKQTDLENASDYGHKYSSFCMKVIQKNFYE